jgi:hypothetical protein
MEALPLLVSGGADPARGDALARSVPQPYHRSRAVAALAVLAAAAGEPDRAAALRDAVSDAERARNILTLPTRPLKRKHPEPCSDLPDYAAAWQATFTLVAQYGDLRACPEGSLTPFVGTCCGQQAVRDAREAGKQAWLEARAKKIRRSSFLMTATRAMEEARSDLWRIERNLDGWG